MNQHQAILQFMVEQINKHGLQILQNYPDDVYKHDLNYLKDFAVPGMQFGWVVGHTHTHIVALGLHQVQNELVHAFTNLSSSDRFYHLVIGKDSTFTAKELSRDAFSSLSSVKIQYHAEGECDESFILKRGDSRIALCQTRISGSVFTERVKLGKYKALTSLPLPQEDEVAVKLWIATKLNHLAGSLFGRTEIEEGVFS